MSVLSRMVALARYMRLHVSAVSESCFHQNRSNHYENSLISRVRFERGGGSYTT